jgi:NDP-sugar pyrophosphorylase family protein
MTSVAPIAILAGGLATRLRPLTETIPKSLIDINGEPFIHHQLRLLKSAGLRRVVVCAGYLGEMIREQVGDGSRFGIEVVYSFDGPKLLGTAGALRNARQYLGDAFQVVYGDSFLKCDYLAVQEAFVRSGKMGLMTVYHNEGHYDTSNIEFVGGEILAYDKKNRTDRMRYIDYGLGMLQTTVLDGIADGEPCDLATLYGNLLAQGQLAAFEVADRFYEIGSIAGIEETRRLLRESAS